MLAFLEGPDLIVVLVIVLVLFGGTKLPQIARSIGQAKSEFERGVRGVVRPADPAVKPPPGSPATLTQAGLDKLVDDRVRRATRDPAANKPVE